MGTEGIQDKYINPYTDFGFKLLFGTAMNKELFEAAEIAKFNPKELGEYWESLKNFRDWYSVMSTQLKKGREEGLKEGIEKGLKEGLEQGRKEECFKNAKKMKQAGIAFDVIAQVTGLSIGEIASL
jgi:predicted transposase/invertase (TIGR01784 family)